MKAKFIVTILLAAILTGCAAPSNTFPNAESTAPIGMSTPTIATPTGDPQPTAGPADDSSQSATVSFSGDILPLLDGRCKNCHGGQKTEKGLNLLTYVDIMKGSENGPVVIPGNSDNSLLAELLINQKMPKRGPKLTPPQIQTIVDWINQGALDN